MKNCIILTFIISSFTVSILKAQSTLIVPNAIGVPNVATNPTCNVATKGFQVYNTTANKMYFCNGTAWVDMTVGGFTLPYSGSGSVASPTNLFSLSNAANGTTMFVENTGSGRAIYAKSISGSGVRGESETSTGVSATSESGTGLFGHSDSSYGVYAESSTGFGLYAISYGSQYSALISGAAKVTNKLAIGNITYSDLVARLHIKGLNISGWGQHIRMEEKDSDNYGDIMYDSGGMKFRTFRAGDAFIFRNSENSTLATIEETGDITVKNGKGIVRSADATQLKIIRTAVVLTGNSLAAGGSLTSGDLFYEPFSGIPTVTVGQIDDASATGDWYKVLIVPIQVASNKCKLRIYNTSSATISFNATWNFLIVGPQ